MQLNFNGRVALVTGAGSGLGRAYALELARRGASVIVNDLAQDDNQRRADHTVNAIRAAGGKAAANYDSVEFGDRAVICAMDTFGRLDVLINNAGILRDRTLAKMSDEEWDGVYRTHLFGCFRTTQSAWQHMREAGYGRVLMTSSASGIYGNFGQANYAAAKAGLIGFAKTLALEGASKNIRVNAIAPVAISNLSAHALPQGAHDALSTERLVPLAMLLTHEKCPANGQLFEAGGGWFSETRWEQSQGTYLSEGGTAEDLAARWHEVTNFKGALNLTDGNESVARLLREQD